MGRLAQTLGLTFPKLFPTTSEEHKTVEALCSFRFEVRKEHLADAYRATF